MSLSKFAIHVINLSVMISALSLQTTILDLKQVLSPMANNFTKRKMIPTKIDPFQHSVAIILNSSHHQTFRAPMFNQ